MVTETDLAVERFVRSEIAQRYPSHAFIGEESDAGGVISNFSSAPTWIVDPIDGTTNFVHGFPEVSSTTLVNDVHTFADSAVPALGLHLDWIRVRKNAGSGVSSACLSSDYEPGSYGRWYHSASMCRRLRKTLTIASLLIFLQSFSQGHLQSVS